MKQFPGFSEMQVSDGTFRVSWDGFHERMKIEYIKASIYVAIDLSLEQGEQAGRELMRLAEEAKAKRAELAMQV